MSKKQNSGMATLLKKEPSGQMVQRPVLGRVEKAILKEIDFYGEKKPMFTPIKNKHHSSDTVSMVVGSTGCKCVS